MTAPQPMTPEEQLEDLQARVDVLEQLVRQNHSIVARAVIKHLTDEVIITELIKRVAAAVESEWSGKFLPELRALLLRRVENLETMAGVDGESDPTLTS